MKILIAHNSYQHRGGEDAVVEAEAALLQQRGHEIEIYARHNDELHGMPAAAAALGAVWSSRSAAEVDRICRRFRPDLIHVHNVFPLISPALYWAAARLEIPVVQTLHNFRLVCPQAMLLRDGKICEDCVGKVPWRAVVRKCYRESTLQSAVSFCTLTMHRALGTFNERISRFIALNSFCRDKFIAGGLPADRISVKPNFYANDCFPQWADRAGGLFAGRLSFEKGLDVLGAAAQSMSSCSVKVVGRGPLEEDVTSTFGRDYLGFRSQQEVVELLRQSLYLVAPSACYENFPLVVVEAFASGTPVIASRHGSYAALVEDGVTGMLFAPGDAQELAQKIAWADAHPEEMKQMGRRARAEYESKYTPAENYRLLMNIYHLALQESNGEQNAARQVA
jgi:glycosyltransferase involved in cell wall biosynthesis